MGWLREHYRLDDRLPEHWQTEPAIVAEPAALRVELTGKERAYLRAHADMLSLEHPTWRGSRS